MSILLFILVLFALILVHEWGHFFAAKKLGMRVDEFGIGFPPRLASFQKGETAYSINLLPIGGFVRIFGEDAGAIKDDPDRARAFSSRPKWAQAVVLVAGVAMNALFAWVLFAAVLAIGTPTAVAPEEATDAAELYIVDVIPASPAADAQVPRGAKVEELSAGARSVMPRTPAEFQAFVAEAGEAPITLAYTYGDARVTTELVAAGGVLPEDGRAAVGVSLGMVEVRSLPLHEAIGEGFLMTVTGLRDITVGIVSLITDAVRFDADLSAVAGPVGIVELVGDASALGLTTLLAFTAFISLNLAIINLLPFPALDGGRLLFVAIEAVSGRQIPVRVAQYANTVGFVLLILLMVAITYNDILRIT